MSDLDFDKFIRDHKERDRTGVGQVMTYGEKSADVEEPFTDEDQKAWDEWEALRTAQQERKRRIEESLKEESISHGSAHLDIGNSGVTLSIVDEGNGATVRIHSGAFGGFNHEFKMNTDQKSLRILGMMFLTASEQQYTDVYCHAARFWDGEPSDENDLEVRAQQLGFRFDDSLASSLPDCPRRPPGERLMGYGSVGSASENYGMVPDPDGVEGEDHMSAPSDEYESGTDLGMMEEDDGSS